MCDGVKRLFNSWVAAVISLLVSPYAVSGGLTDLEFYTEVGPPQNYEVKGKATGIAVDLLLAASENAGDKIKPSQITVLAWDKAYQKALSEPNAVIFSAMRTKHREHLFHWVGPIQPFHVVLLARKDTQIKVAGVQDLAKYKIGVIRDDIGEQLMLDMGTPRNSLHEAADAVTLIKLLYKKRIDMIAYGESPAKYWASTVGIDHQVFESVYTLEKGELYYALNKHIDQSLVEQLQQGIDKVKLAPDDGSANQYDKILSKYR